MKEQRLNSLSPEKQMHRNNKLHFIVIDDSKLDCFIVEKLIKYNGTVDSVKSFMQATDALEYISHSRPEEGVHTILLIDIQMPVMNGFEFLKAFDNLSQEIKRNYTVYVISSSVNDDDSDVVKIHSTVKQFINKPFTSHSLARLLENANC